MSNPIDDIYYADLPAIVRDFLEYHLNARNHSPASVRGYACDLRILYRVLAIRHGLADEGAEFRSIDVAGLPDEFIRKATLEDLYAFQIWAEGDAVPAPATRARRTSCVKSYFHWLTYKRKLVTEDISEELDMPKIPAALPRFLEEEDCRKLVDACKGRGSVRDRAIILLFLSCGLRVSELVGLNVKDVRGDHVLVRGKGDKERVVYFGQSCRDALDAWLVQRESIEIAKSDRDALFVSQQHRRICVRAVANVVKGCLEDAGLDAENLSCHKLRHTAATLMLKNGVDTRVLQEVLGHRNLNTTQIYTHVTSGALRAAALANPI